MSVLVDTSVLFAAARTRDNRNEAAARLLNDIGTRDVVTTDHVITEAWTLINARYGRPYAMAFWNGVAASPFAIEQVSLVDLERARGIANAWADQNFSIVDCTSFVVMERLGIRKVATFDND